MNGIFCWNELLTRDVAGAQRFYGEVFGWTFELSNANPEVTYVIAKLDGKPIAGIFDISAEKFDGVSPHWFSYIATEDVTASGAAALAAGATTVRERFAVPGVGHITLLTDPTGATVGFFEPSEEMGYCCA